MMTDRPPQHAASGKVAHSRRKRAARMTISVLPTMFTLGNVLFGFAAIFMASRDPTRSLPLTWTPLTYAAAFIFAGMVMDALDGRIARMTRNTSELGAQLDSMADMVTFGVAPAFLAIQLMAIETPFLSEQARGQWGVVMVYFNRLALVTAGIYVACAALRLARFNIETTSAGIEDHLSFKGLPSPAAAGTVASIILVHQYYLADLSPGRLAPDDPNRPWTMWVSAIVLVIIMLLAALAMVSRMRYAHLANRYLRGKTAFNSVVKAVIGVLVLMVIGIQRALALAFCVYALSAPVKVAMVWLRARGRAGSSSEP